MIQPYMVAIAVGLSILAVAFLTRMPILARISLIVPRLFLFVIYALPMTNTDRLPLLRGGLLGLFICDLIVEATLYYGSHIKKG